MGHSPSPVIAGYGGVPGYDRSEPAMAYQPASLFLRALGFGLAVAAPVGPMALLCMRRTLDQGWRAGLATGAGIASADALYAALAAFGLAGASRLLLAHATAFRLGAGAVLLWLGLSTLRGLARPAPAAAAPRGSLYLGALALTLANPPTILTFAALFTALAPAGGFPPAAALATTAGVLLGSALWWLFLVGLLAALGHALGRRLRAAITLAAGTALALFGLATLAGLG